jgi:hypothetical protein
MLKPSKAGCIEKLKKKVTFGEIFLPVLQIPVEVLMETVDNSAGFFYLEISQPLPIFVTHYTFSPVGKLE